MSTPTLSSTTPADAAPARPDQPLLPMAILGTGEALPRRVVTTAEVATRCGLPADEAEQRSGVLTRHWISPDEDPLDLGVAAARSALADAGLTIADIDCVLNASGTPMQAIPDGGALLAAELGMAPTKSAYSVHGTCLSFLFALREAALLIAHADRVEETLAEVGNTIAAGIPLTLHRARIQPGERLLLVGSGAGTHFGALLVQN